MLVMFERYWKFEPWSLIGFWLSLEVPAAAAAVGAHAIIDPTTSAAPKKAGSGRPISPRTVAQRCCVDRASRERCSRRAHVPTEDSSHSPKLVNATITASIQY